MLLIRGTREEGIVMYLLYLLLTLTKSGIGSCIALNAGPCTPLFLPRMLMIHMIFSKIFNHLKNPCDDHHHHRLQVLHHDRHNSLVFNNVK